MPNVRRKATEPDGTANRDKHKEMEDSWSPIFLNYCLARLVLLCSLCNCITCHGQQVKQQDKASPAI